MLLFSHGYGIASTSSRPSSRAYSVLRCGGWWKCPYFFASGGQHSNGLAAVSQGSCCARGSLNVESSEKQRMMLGRHGRAVGHQGQGPSDPSTPTSHKMAAL
jgi:hypothetical protein